jgi:hypothetical protein
MSRKSTGTVHEPMRIFVEKEVELQQNERESDHLRCGGSLAGPDRFDLHRPVEQVQD